MGSAFKRISAYLGIVLLSTLLVLGMLVCVMRSARVQTAAAGVIAEQLSRALDARVDIGTLDYKFPNRLLISRVLIEDQQQDTMLFVDTLSAQADLWRFLTEDTLCIRRIDLAGGFADIHYIEAEEPELNCRFLIDAFSSGEQKPKKPLGINLQIKDIALRELYLNYCDWSAYLPSSAIHLRDISAEHLDAEIEQFTLYAEHQGVDLDIDNIHAHLLLTDSTLSFPKFRVEMPRSDFHIEEFTIRRSELQRLLATANGGHAALADTASTSETSPQGAETFSPLSTSSTSPSGAGISLHVHEATVTPADFAALVPALRSMRQPVTFTACLQGNVDSLVASDLKLAYDRVPVLAGNVAVLRTSHIDSLYLRAQVEDLSLNKHTLQDILSAATGQPVCLPDMLARLGQVHYRGALEGRLEDLTLRGAFTSALGSIRTDGHASINLPGDSETLGTSDTPSTSPQGAGTSLSFRGILSTRRFDLGRLLDMHDMGIIALTVNTDGSLMEGRPFSGHVNANVDALTYRGYTYRDIAVDGFLHDRIFDGDIDSADPNLALCFKGSVDLNTQDPAFDFNLRLDHFRPGKLHLSERYPQLDLALRLNIDIQGARLDNFRGTMHFDSIRLSNDGQDFFVRELNLIAFNAIGGLPAGADYSRGLTINSDVINARLTGNYSYATLPTSVLRCIARYVPKAFSAQREQQLLASHPDNSLDFAVYFNRLDRLCSVLHLPLSFHEMSTIKGELSDHNGTVLLQAVIPDLQAAGQHIEGLTLSVDNADEQRLNLSLIGLLHSGNSPAGRHMGDLDYYLNASARADSVLLDFSWANATARHSEHAPLLSGPGTPGTSGTSSTPPAPADAGTLRVTTSLARYSGRPLISAHIHPSRFVLADSIWSLADSRIDYSAADTAVHVDEFLLSSAHQSIYINGVASRAISDSIYAELDNINLDYLLGALTDVHSAIWFGGTVTGWATGYGLLSSPMFEANVQMLNGQINGNLLGDVYATATFDREDKHVLIQGNVFDPRLPAAPSRLDTFPARRVFSSKPYPAQNPSTSGTIRTLSNSPSDASFGPSGSGRRVVHLDGEVCTSDARWGLKIYPDSVDISFVSYWVGSFLSQLQGRASGEVFVRGGKYPETPTSGTFETSETLSTSSPASPGPAGRGYTTVTLSALPHNASFVLPFTGARYFVADSICLDSTGIVFRDMTLHDVEGNPIEFSGAVRHDGTFRNMDIRLTAIPHRAIVLDMPEGSGDFWGRVFADGIATVQGNDNELYVTADATSAARSSFTLSLAGASSAHSNEFIEFVDHSSKPFTNLQIDQFAKSSKFHTYLDLRMSVNELAEVSVLLDNKTGDRLRGRGEGDIRFRYADVENQMQMLGTYVLQSGTFGFTFQNVIRREFQIAEGSSVTWTGNPEDPTVDVRALYHTTASLRDLFGADYSAVSPTNRSNLPVNCVLNLSDRLVNPTLRFGIEFPSSDESVSSQVQSVINTEEMLMRQVLYLLVFNRFYTPDYLKAEDTGMGVNETYSLISSTVTGQINSWLSKLTDKFSVGFNMRTDGEGANSSQEYEAQFEINPVRGLIINGNFGYRYNDISNQPVFGNLDVEYMLTPNGKLRAKAYTHTFDRYSLRQASTIQGVGFIFKHDFNWNDTVARARKKENRAIRREQRQKQQKQKR